MPLRVVVRSLLVAALSLLGWMVVERPPVSPGLAAGGVVALAFCAPAPLILGLRWIRPRTTAMMIATRARLAREQGRPPEIARAWVPLSSMSREMWRAAIAAEDGYFGVHSGFDWQSIREAWAHNRTHERKRGGSTITQQVAKNLFLWPGRSWTRKAIEAHLTMLIEALWPKRRILEVYLNVAQFGEGLFGVEAASRRYFTKPARELTTHEAAQLAAALPNPMQYQVTRPSHQMRFRQSWILLAMRRVGDVYLERL